mmetsp:Transcript_70413/g.114407  ORF Transcript_70413/g.114407 Transcript_70413/m.114407 type:complete len:100 (+) Transcript_70413:1206-1505(+)
MPFHIRARPDAQMCVLSFVEFSAEEFANSSMGSDTICDEAVDAVEQNFGEFEQQAVRARFYFMQRFGFLFLHFHSSFLLAALRMHFEVQTGKGSIGWQH